MSARKSWQRNLQRSGTNRSSSAKRSKGGIHKFRIAIKFCGSCNPEIDLSAFSSTISQIVSARSDVELVPFASSDVDLVIILCGCLRACADNEEIKTQSKKHIIIAGESLNSTHYLEKELPDILSAEIARNIA